MFSGYFFLTLPPKPLLFSRSACSRPHLVKLLEEGKIQYTKVGKHRRIVFEDVVEYKKQMKAEQKNHLIDMMNLDEDLGFYDS